MNRQNFLNGITTNRGQTGMGEGSCDHISEFDVSIISRALFLSVYVGFVSVPCPWVVHALFLCLLP